MTMLDTMMWLAAAGMSWTLLSAAVASRRAATRPAVIRRSKQRTPR